MLQTSTSSRTTTAETLRLNERILIEHSVTHPTLEPTVEKKFQAALSTKKTTHVLHILLRTTSPLLRRPGWIAFALLADRQDNDPDPEVSVQLEQAKERAYLPFGEEKGQEQKQGQVSCSFIMFAIGDSPTADGRTESREPTAMLYGRKGHCTYDRERAMFPSSLSPKPQTHAARTRTRLHLSGPTGKGRQRVSFLNDCSDGSGTLADTDDQNVLLPKESTAQTVLTSTDSTASTAIDTRTESVSDGLRRGERRRTNGQSRPITSQAGTQDSKSRAYRGMPSGVVL